MSRDKIFLEFSPATGYNDAQVQLMTDVTLLNQPNLNLMALMNRCEWSVSFRIICDNLDSGQQTLNPGEMCRVSFWTDNPKDTLVFCQTKDVTGRKLDFDAWGGSAPRGLNVWSLLPNTKDGLALSGLIRKSWVVPETSAFAEENDLSEDEYFALQDEKDMSSDQHNGRTAIRQTIREFAV